MAKYKNSNIRRATYSNFLLKNQHDDEQYNSGNYTLYMQRKQGETTYTTHTSYLLHLQAQLIVKTAKKYAWIPGATQTAPLLHNTWIDFVQQIQKRKKMLNTQESMHSKNLNYP